MCWSISASAVATIIGGAGTIYEIKRGAPRARWFMLLFFTLMELLQLVSYFWINQCSIGPNIWLTQLSYLHISLQIPVISFFALSFVPEKIRRVWVKPIMVISFVCAILMAIRLLVPLLWEVPTTWLCKHFGDGLCGQDTCTYQGNWHLAWRLPLLGFDRHFLLYAIPVFILPIIYGNWRFSLFAVLTGPVLVSFLTTNKNEAPAIWCLFATALILGLISKPIRVWLETPLRALRKPHAKLH